MATSTTRSNNKMNFLGLPGELRNRIYRYLVVYDSPTHILELKWTKDQTGYYSASIPQPPLARTCKTIRQECLSLYCGENTFNIGLSSAGHQLSMNEVSQSLERWLASLGDCARHLRHVTISANCEILGPKNSACWVRDFWEFIEFSIRVDGAGGLEYNLRGDPSFDEMCTCELDCYVGDGEMRVPDLVVEAGRLWFQTTVLGECEGCKRPRLREPVRKDGCVYIS